MAEEEPLEGELKLQGRSSTQGKGKRAGGERNKNALLDMFGAKSASASAKPVSRDIEDLL